MDFSLSNDYFSNQMGFGGQYSNSNSAQNLQGSTAGGGLIGGIINAIHNGVYDWATLLDNRNNQRRNLRNAEEQIKLQREFAQNGIQWRVADAKKAGIHPLYALGANTATYTPVDMQQPPLQHNVRNPYESFIQGQSSVLALENQKLQNELLQSQIDSNNLQNSQVSTQMANSTSADDINAIVTRALDSKFKGYGDYFGFGLSADDWKQMMQERGSESPISFGLLSVFDRILNHRSTLDGKKIDLGSIILGAPRTYDAENGQSLLSAFFDYTYQPREVIETIKDWFRALYSFSKIPLRNRYSR